jgi:predicted transcriptional regulator
MNIKVSEEIVTIVATDEILVQSANAALKALNDQSRPAGAADEEPAAAPEGSVTPGGVIRGADLSGLPATNLAKAWAALHDALAAITTSAQAAAQADAVQAATTRAEASQQAEPGTGTSDGPEASTGTDGTTG